ncbi:MAG: glycerol-3-phosphate acyltransferase [Candidatus Kapaibacterium sp.]|jgi:glycerol-3-phosphate acyltransferase PlsY
MELVITIIVCYFIGAIPSSYLLVKFFGKKNIFQEGSGNPGALNSYESTDNKYIGTSVLLLDILKGIAAAYFAYSIAGNNYVPFLAGLIWVIIGNNYNIFFGLKGGRGLAVAAGAFGAASPYFVFTWLIMWLTSYFMIKKNVHVANAIALIAAPILVFSTADAMLDISGILTVGDKTALKITYSLSCFVILIRHFKPLREFALKNNS